MGDHYKTGVAKGSVRFVVLVLLSFGFSLVDSYGPWLQLVK